MHILLTGSHTPLGNSIHRRLSARYAVSTLPERDVLPSGNDNAPRDLQTLGRLCHGVDAVVHAESFQVPLPPDDFEEALAFHRAVTDTSHLCQAAMSAGVDRIVVAASLNVFDSIPPEFRVDEMWRPRPAPDASQLLPYLAAECVREYVRHGPIRGICLRFSPLGENPASETSLAAALEAVDRALTLSFDPSGYRWHCFHVAHSPRFLDRDARRILGLATCPHPPSP